MDPNSSNCTNSLNPSPFNRIHAAYLVGHRSFTVQLWHKLLVERPTPEWNTRTAVPLSTDQIYFALSTLVADIDSTTATSIRRELKSLTLINDSVITIFDDDNEEVAIRLQNAESEAVASWKVLNELVSCLIPTSSELFSWLHLGRVIGQYQLAAYDLVAQGIVLNFQPVIDAAKLVTKGGCMLPVVTALAFADEVLQKQGTAAAIQSALLPPTTILNMDPTMEAYVVFHATLSLSADIEEAFERHQVRIEPSVVNEKSSVTQSREQWYHHSEASKPEEFRFGKIEGHKKDLARWILPQSGKQDPRALETAALEGRVWIIKLTRNAYQAWFKSQERYAAANTVWQREIAAAQQSSGD